VIAAIGIC